MLKLSMFLSLLAYPLVAGNPFAGHAFYVNPSYQAELDASIATSTDPNVTATLKQMREVPSAYWIDVKSKITGSDTKSVGGILADAASKSPPQLITLIVYDLPNRDCKAKASNGEICCNPNADGTCDYNKGGTCDAGLAEYQKDYIDPFSTIVKKYIGKVPIVLIVEPDSLPNLASNMQDPHCGNDATVTSYKSGVAYAVNTFAAAGCTGEASQCTMYIDAAHGGWLGWDDNLVAFTNVISELNIASKIRGFSTNVANYQPLGEQCPFVPNKYGGSPTRNDFCLPGGAGGPSHPCCADPCNLEHQYNPGNNELNYAQSLVFVMGMKIPGFSPKVVIDTGRNGMETKVRSDCANWCNPRGMGVGHFPTVDTANSSYIDAYYWLKTPGESDGCTASLPDGSSCPRFDSFCGSPDSIGSASGEPRAPQAGQWFDYQIKQLASNANMGPLPPPGPPTPPPPTPAPPTPTPPTPSPAATCNACGYNCHPDCSNCGRCNTKPGCDSEAHCLGTCNSEGNAKWCGAPSPSPPTPPPTPPPSPTPPPPPTPPAGDCPGGSLSACIGLCPADPPVAYQACVKECAVRCS